MKVVNHSNTATLGNQGSKVTTLGSNADKLGNRSNHGNISNQSQMQVGHHVKRFLLLSHFNENWEVSTYLTIHNTSFTWIGLKVVELFQEDKRKKKTTWRR